MITVEEAKHKILTQVSPLAIEERAVIETLNLYLAEDVISPVSIPLFNQSAMDGYAFQFNNINEPIKIVDEIPAGDTRKIETKNGEAVRIFTGAKVPDSCDTVVMQELTEVSDGKLIIKDQGLQAGGNIRTKGNQISVGSNALKKGTKINAGTVGFLSTLGLTSVKVHQLPKVAIIATGNELITPGNPLKEGQIYESNTSMLQAALKDVGIQPDIFMIEDDKESTINAIAKTLKTNDLLIISGGISVGDYDFVKEALEKNGTKEVFYKIKQKPGKPLYFGKTTNCYVFGLPGNPAAALTCFYEYALMAIHILMGRDEVELIQLNLPIASSFTKKTGRACFLKAFTNFKSVIPLEGQGSDALQAFSKANCLIYTKEGDSLIKENQLVEIHLLP